MIFARLFCCSDDAEHDPGHATSAAKHVRLPAGAHLSGVLSTATQYDCDARPAKGILKLKASLPSDAGLALWIGTLVRHLAALQAKNVRLSDDNAADEDALGALEARCHRERAARLRVEEELERERAACQAAQERLARLRLQLQSAGPDAE